MKTFLYYLMQTIAVGISLFIFLGCIGVFGTLLMDDLSSKGDYNVINYILIICCLFSLTGTFIPGIRVKSYILLTIFVSIFVFYVYQSEKNRITRDDCAKLGCEWDETYHRCNQSCLNKHNI